MAKSKSQRMKEYRARKKEQLGEAWMKKERARVKGYYIPTELLTDGKKQERREKNKTNAKTFYDTHKKKKLDEIDLDLENNDTGNEIHSLSEEEDNTVSSTTSGLMIVKMPFPSTSKQMPFPSTSKPQRKTKRQSRALKRSYDRIKRLEDEAETLKRKLKTAQKRIQRFDSTQPKNPTTPRSKTKVLLHRAGLKGKDVPEIKKQLVYAECVSEELRNTMSDNTKEVASHKRIISGKVIKKYRMRSYFQDIASIGRRRKLEHDTLEKQSKRRLRAEKVKSDVKNFLLRDDNSRVMPGKSDCVKVGKQKTQKRILNDYLYNLHIKFLSESDYKISKATFSRLRPKELTLVNFASRSVCLCQKHQNMCFKLKALKLINVYVNTSPDSFVNTFIGVPEQLDNLLSNITQPTVRFQQWKRVKLTNGKERMRIVDVDQERDEFVCTMKKDFAEFAVHVERLTKQYKAIKAMKDRLPNNHVLVQMDFSENYTCQTVEEIQTAYWNAPMVTLHPTIVYYNGENETLCHKSIVYVSEMLSHNASMVSAIISKLIPTVQELVPNLKFVHFWTDSPSSQYRNKSIFDMISRFENEYGCKATWQYFEAGHGKSACDGVGGTAKRNADMAVKRGKAIIQDANDYFAWAMSNESEIEYFLVTPEEYEKNNEDIENRKKVIRPLKGTMSLHSVAVATEGLDKTMLLTRETTCVCESCFGEDGFKGASNCHWNMVTLKTVNPHTEKSTSSKVDESSDMPIDANLNVDSTGIVVSDFVVAGYEGIAYIGQVLEVDNTDNSVHVNFMAESGKALRRFKWPSKVDQIWVEGKNILTKIEPPKATGKGGRMFTVSDNVIRLMEGQCKIK